MEKDASYKDLVRWIANNCDEEEACSSWIVDREPEITFEAPCKCKITCVSRDPDKKYNLCRFCGNHFENTEKRFSEYFLRKHDAYAFNC